MKKWMRRHAAMEFPTPIPSVRIISNGFRIADEPSLLTDENGLNAAEWTTHCD